MRYASERLRGNSELMLRAVENPNLEFTSYGNNRVIGETGSPLEYAFNELKNDREVVLNAIYHSVDAFKLASPELRGDPEVIWAAANQFQPEGGLSLRDVLGNIPEVFFQIIRRSTSFSLIYLTAANGKKVESRVLNPVMSRIT